MKRHLQIRIHKSLQKGFSLVELIIYMGVLSILIGVMSVLFSSILNAQLDSASTSSVDQDARYIQARMAYDMQRASSIVSVTSTTLQVLANSINYTYSLDGSGNLQITDNTGSYQLNSADTTVSGLSFQSISNGSNNTVRVTYTVTSDIQETSGQEARTVQTTLGLQ